MFHLIGMVALLIVGSLLIYSTVYIEWYKCIQVESYLIHEQILQWFLGARCQLYEEKMAAGVSFDFLHVSPCHYSLKDF